MSYDLHSLRTKENNSLVRLLFQRVRGLCGGACDFGKAAKTATGNTPVSADAAKETDAPANSECGESGGVKL